MLDNSHCCYVCADKMCTLQQSLIINQEYRELTQSFANIYIIKHKFSTQS